MGILWDSQSQVSRAQNMHSKEIGEIPRLEKIDRFQKQKMAGEMVVEVFVYNKWNGGWGWWCITKCRILRCDFHFH